MEVLASQAPPALSRVSLYLTPPRVTIDPPGAVAVSPVEVALSSRAGAAIRYTLDGTEPTSASPLATGPVRVAGTATLRARAFDGRGPSPVTAAADFRVLGEDQWKAATSFLVPPTPGLRASLFEGGWQTLDQMEGRAPLEVRDAAGFDIALATRAEQCAIAFEGFVDVPEDGLYTFATLSDDGSRLYVDGERVVENDGLHGMDRREGKVALRNIRRDAIDKVKKQEKEGEFSEDQSRDEQDKVQKLTDKFIAEIEKLLAEKEADILKV